MTPLSKNARLLIQAAKTAVPSDPNLRNRVWHSIAPSVSDVSPPPNTRARRASAEIIPSRTVTKALLGGIAIVAFGYGGYELATTEPPRALVLSRFDGPIAYRAAEPLPSPPAPASPSLPPTPSPGSHTVSIKPTRAQARDGADDLLAHELALIEQAQRDIDAGAATTALTALRDFERKHPSLRRGSLREERLLLEAVGACRLGQVAQAATAEASLERLNSKSPHLARLRDACPQLNRLVDDPY